MIKSTVYGKQSARILSRKNSRILSPTGMHFVLFSHTMALLFRRTIEKTEIDDAMVLVAILMWIIATVVCDSHLSYVTKPVVDFPLSR